MAIIKENISEGDLCTIDGEEVVTFVRTNDVIKGTCIVIDSIGDSIIVGFERISKYNSNDSIKNWKYGDELSLRNGRRVIYIGPHPIIKDEHIVCTIGGTVISSKSEDLHENL